MACLLLLLGVPGVASAVGPSNSFKLRPLAGPAPNAGSPDASRVRPQPRDTAAQPFDKDQLAAAKGKRSTAPSTPAAETPGSGPAAPSAQAPAFTTNFAALDRGSSENHGFIFYPPDTTVASAGNGKSVLEATNSAIRLYTGFGSSATTDLNTFLAAPTGFGALVFDPKVYFDRNTFLQRYYVVGLQKTGSGDSNPNNNSSFMFIAVSRSAQPTSLDASQWCRYSFNARRDAGTATDSWADYPGLGTGQDAVVVSDNQFNFSTGAFTYALVTAFNKDVMSNNGSSCPTVPSFRFRASPGLNDGNAFTLQPVQHYTSPSSSTGVSKPAYLLNTLQGSDNLETDARIGVWRVANVGVGSPQLQRTNVATFVASQIPPDAAQSGTSSLLATNDKRMTSAAGVGNTIVGVNSARCDFGGGPAESCWEDSRFSVGGGTSGPSASLQEQHLTGFGAGTFAWMPGVALNQSLQSAVVVQRSASNAFLSARTLTKNSGAPWSGELTLATGTCPQTAYDRTGDYTGAQTDPADFKSFWVAAERATNVFGTGCDWATRVARLTP